MKSKLWLGSIFFLFICVFIAVQLFKISWDEGVIGRLKASPESNHEFHIAQLQIEQIKSHAAAEVQQSQISFLGTSSDVTNIIHEYEIRYILSREGRPDIKASAQVFFPDKSEQILPVLVYGPGTTGLASRCAPSLENPMNPTLGNYQNQMISYANEGMIVIMPDYLGFDTKSQFQHYFIAQEEAYSMLSAAQALAAAVQQQLLSVGQPIDQVFLGGYSQGGHAAFAAADFAQDLTPTLKVRGIIGHGPTTDVVHTLESNPNLAPYIVTAYQQFYSDFDSTKIIRENFYSSLSQAKQFCADEGFGYDSVNPEEIYSTEFLASLKNTDQRQEFDTIFQILDQNAAGTKFTTIPVFIAQADDDTIVTLENQQQFVAQLCQRDVPVTLSIYPDQGHFNTRQRAHQDTLDWIATVLDNNLQKQCIDYQQV